MKKTLFLLLLPFLSIGQESDAKITTGEIKTNLFDLVVAKTVNVGYEHYLKGNQSLQLDVNLFDNYSYYDVSDLKSNNLFSVQASYNIYFSKTKAYNGFVFYPLIKYRTGTQEFDYNFYYDNSVSNKKDLSGLEVGFGLGHKWMFNDRISLGIGSQIGRNLSNDKKFSDYYSDIDFRANVTIGVRF